MRKGYSVFFLASYSASTEPKYSSSAFLRAETASSNLSNVPKFISLPLYLSLARHLFDRLSKYTPLAPLVLVEGGVIFLILESCVPSTNPALSRAFSVAYFARQLSHIRVPALVMVSVARKTVLPQSHRHSQAGVVRSPRAVRISERESTVSFPNLRPVRSFSREHPQERECPFFKLEAKTTHSFPQSQRHSHRA